MGQDLWDLEKRSRPFLREAGFRPIPLLRTGGSPGLARGVAPGQFPVGTAPVPGAGAGAGAAAAGVSVLGQHGALTNGRGAWGQGSRGAC